MRMLPLIAGLMFAAGTAQAATIFTGDKIDGVAVISQLDVADLAPGKTHRFFFQGTTDGIGQAQYVPVIVAKGVKDGKLVATVFQDARGQGAGAIEVAAKLAKGESVPKTTFIPFQLVTPANIADYQAKN